MAPPRIGDEAARSHPDPAPHAAAVAVDVISSVAELEAHAASWDRLAVRCGQPRSSPALLVPWYRHRLRPGTEPRVVVASEGGVVVGVLPMWTVRRRSGLVGAGPAGESLISGAPPLFAPDRAPEIAAAMARAVATIEPVPDVIRLGWSADAARWAPALAAAWPGRPAETGVDARLDAPAIDTGGGVAAWLDRRTRKFAETFRRRRRQLAGTGAAVRVVDDPRGVVGALPHLARLYLARSDARSGSIDVGPAFADMVTETAEELEGTGRLRCTLIEHDGVVVAASLSLAAGPTVTEWIHGFDPAWGRYSPGTQLLAADIDRAAAGGQANLDLGPGDEPYKAPIADRVVELERWAVARRRLRPFHSPAQLVPHRTRKALGTAASRLGSRMARRRE